MSEEEQIRLWTERFRLLGAYDPDSWAKSQVKEGIPQYARFIFLRQAWKEILDDDDAAWIDSEIASAAKRPSGPGAGIGLALKRILALGADREDLTEIVRVMQWELLSRIAYQLSDPGVVEYPDESFPKVNWELFEVDSKNNPLHPIGGLHESILDTDPTGREMRPKGISRDG